MTTLTEATKKLKKLGLVERTTKRQEKNGSKYFFDTQTGAGYAFTSRGYAYRVIDGDEERSVFYYPLNRRNRNKEEKQYSLNRNKAQSMVSTIHFIENYRKSR